MDTNCNEQEAASNIDNILSTFFHANVLPMFRMQYFCNNVRFATTPICNTFLLNKDIWSKVVQIFSEKGDYFQDEANIFRMEQKRKKYYFQEKSNIFKTNFSPDVERP